MTMEIKLTPEMNAQIPELLRISDEPLQLYAAAYIESLSTQITTVTAEREAATSVLDDICEHCGWETMSKECVESECVICTYRRNKGNG
jgi:hypothetical protein